MWIFIYQINMDIDVRKLKLQPRLISVCITKTLSRKKDHLISTYNCIHSSFHPPRVGNYLFSYQFIGGGGGGMKPAALCSNNVVVFNDIQR